MSRLTPCAVLLMGYAAVTAFAQGTIRPQAAPEPGRAPAVEEERARALFFLSDGSGEGRHAGLRVKLYTRTAQCDIVPVPLDGEFVAGQSVRFGVETNAKGFVYIVQRGSSGRQTLLFPHPEINGGANAIRRGSELVVPGSAWFTFDEKPGVEEIAIIFSRKKADIIPFLVQAVGAGAAPPQAAAGSIEAEVLSAMQGGGQRDLVMSSPAAVTPAASAGAAATSAPAPAGFVEALYAVNPASSGVKDFCVVTMKLKHR